MKIKTNKGVYLIRGNYTPAQLRARYAAYVKKFGNLLDFDEWLRARGGVYIRLLKESHVDVTKA